MLEQIKEIISHAFPDMDTSKITTETRLIDDLAFDSLSTIMLSMELEETFGFRFNEFVKFETIGDVCSYIESILNN